MPSSKPIRVMIIDDSSVARVLLKRALLGSNRELEFIECIGAGEALAKIPSDNPDIVVCDWNMPETTGIELLRLLRPKYPDLFCGFLTTNDSAQERSLAHEIGVDFYLSKPYRPEQAREILSIWDASEKNTRQVA